MQLFLRDNKSVGFLIVLRYFILVLQGTIYYPEIIRFKTYDGYVEFPRVHNQILFDNSLTKLCIQKK